VPTYVAIGERITAAHIRPIAFALTEICLDHSSGTIGRWGHRLIEHGAIDIVANPDFETVLTIEARSNIQLEVIADQFGMSAQEIFREIWSNVRHLRSVLSQKGIDYLELAGALVPKTDREERAFVFDWSQMGGWYGGEVMSCLLPALHRNSSRSVLIGDWAAQVRPRAMLRESGTKLEHSVGGLTAQEIPDTLFFVYLNNLTRSMIAALNKAFVPLRGYVGSLDMTRGSIFKAMLSTMLIRHCVQHRKTVVLGDPDDDDGLWDNAAVSLYDFEEHGFRVRTVPDYLYGPYLSYKIERPVFDFDWQDARFSLNAMSPNPRPLAECHVLLTESRLQYLLSEKAGSLTRADFLGLGAEDIAEQIQRKLDANYIYNLSRSEKFETLKFNIVLEIGRARLVCALKYRPEDKQVEVITLF